jgi:hypothetical protein
LPSHARYFQTGVFYAPKYRARRWRNNRKGRAPASAERRFARLTGEVARLPESAAASAAAAAGFRRRHLIGAASCAALRKARARRLVGCTRHLRRAGLNRIPLRTNDSRRVMAVSFSQRTRSGATLLKSAIGADVNFGDEGFSTDEG